MQVIGPFLRFRLCLASALGCPASFVKVPLTKASGSDKGKRQLVAGCSSSSSHFFLFFFAYIGTNATAILTHSRVDNSGHSKLNDPAPCSSFTIPGLSFTALSRFSALKSWMHSNARRESGFSSTPLVRPTFLSSTYRRMPALKSQSTKRCPAQSKRGRTTLYISSICAPAIADGLLKGSSKKKKAFFPSASPYWAFPRRQSRRLISSFGLVSSLSFFVL